MFTGLVQTVGEIRELAPKAEGARARIAATLTPTARALGASVAIDGVCLTVVDADETGFAVEAAFETLDKTTLGRRRVGDRVNLEPALRVGDPLGGHLVSGHVDGVGRLRRSTPRADARELWFDVPAGLLPLVAPKGSICVDGVSLTVNDVDDTGFMVGIIPHTLSATTLAGLAPRDEVNVEVDLIARYVARLLGFGADKQPGGVTLELLRRAGLAEGS